MISSASSHFLRKTISSGMPASRPPLGVVGPTLRQDTAASPAVRFLARQHGARSPRPGSCRSCPTCPSTAAPPPPSACPAWGNPVSSTTQAGSGSNSAVMRFPNRLPNRAPIPRTLPDELLHGLHVSLGQPRRQGLDGFPLAIQQAGCARIHSAPMAPLTAAHRLQQIDKELLQSLPTTLRLGIGHAQTYQRCSCRVNT